MLKVLERKHLGEQKGKLRLLIKVPHDVSAKD